MTRRDLPETWTTTAEPHAPADLATSLLAASPDPVLCVALDRRVIAANGAAQTLFGASSPLLNITLDELLRVSGPGDSWDARFSRLSQSRFERCEALDVHRGELPAEVTLTWLDRGSAPVVGVLVRDMSRQRSLEVELVRAREAAENAAQTKSAFLANLSHELRTPISGVIGTIGLLLDTQLSAEQREYTEIMYASSEALLNTMDELLVYSSLESGQLRLADAEFDLSSLLDEIVTGFAPHLQKKNLALVTYMHQDVPMQLQGDSHRLRHVLFHLLDNAIKFTPQGRIALSVMVESRADTNVTLRFAVRDTGIGIAPEIQSRLFEPFTQADSSASREHGGSGLGLTICRRLIELMRGTLSLKSAPGRGSAFQFSVPFQVSSASPRRRRKASGLHVLVVDDNSAQRHYLHRQLHAWGVHDTAAAGGAEALRLLRGHAMEGRPFSLALIDLKMPDMDGTRLAQLIRSDPKLHATRLVLMTPPGQTPNPETYQGTGLSGHLSKPLTFSELWKELLLAETPASDAGDIRERPTPVGRGVSDSVKILVAEDNEVNRVVVTRQLEKMGFSPDMVTNGLEVLNATEKTRYDVILMDCQMPKMDGYQATVELRRREQGGEHTVVIAMTAHALKEDREKCLAAGMDDYISKPMRPSDLQETLQRWVSPESFRQPMANPQQASAPVDMDRLNDLAEGADDAIEKLVELYIRTTGEHLQKLDTAIEAGRAEEVEHLAHSAAGSSAMVGMTAIVPPLRELESLAAKHDLSRADRVMGDVRKAFHAIGAWLEAKGLVAAMAAPRGAQAD